MSTEVMPPEFQANNHWWKHFQSGDEISFKTPISAPSVLSVEKGAMRKTLRIFSEGHVLVNEINGNMVCKGKAVPAPKMSMIHRPSHIHGRHDNFDPDQEFIFWVSTDSIPPSMVEKKTPPTCQVIEITETESG